MGSRQDEERQWLASRLRDLQLDARRFHANAEKWASSEVAAPLSDALASIEEAAKRLGVLIGEDPDG